MPKVNLQEKLGSSKHTENSNHHKKKFTFKRKNPLNKIKKIKEQSKPVKEIDYKELDNEMFEAEIDRQKSSEESQKKKKRLLKISQIVIVIACAYLAFLIYGTINTQYIYNEAGEVVPQVMSIKAIKDLDDYNTYVNQYRQARYIYEQVLSLDYRVGAGEEDPLAIAPEYDTILDSINELSIQVSALELPSNYTQSKDMLEKWIQNDVAIYCQSMSKAISQNNADSANIAIEYKTRMYNNFSTITQATITLGRQVKGTDISDLIQWSPEGYVQNNIGGVLDNG